MNREKLGQLLVKSYLIMKDTVSPIKGCECRNKDDPLVCAHYSRNYRCKYNLGQFTVGKTIYINCTASLPDVE